MKITQSPAKTMQITDWLGTDDKMCVDITNKKYFLHADILGHEETTYEFLDRVAGNNPAARNLIALIKFIPGGRILSNRGLPSLGYKTTYSNCYVEPPVKDSIESIYETCKRLARTFSYGGGVGVDISNLAPDGAVVHNSAKKSTGAVSFVSTFSQCAETIGQNNRRK